MRLRVSTFISCISVLFLVLAASAEQSAEQLFQSAVYQEEVAGNLEKAISLYEKVLKLSGDERLAAKAQLQIGVCYEKLGKSEAIKAYELVVRRYSGQKEQVAAALARLAELRREPPKGMSVVKLKSIEKPGIFIQPEQIFPDGTKMVGLEFMKGQNVVVCDPETEEIKYLTEHAWDKSGYCITFNPVLSPDGREVAYGEMCMDAEGTGRNGLSVATLDGRTRILLSDPKQWYVPTSWLPDGNALLTIKGSQSEEAHQLGLVPREGGTFKMLTALQGKDQVVAREGATASASPDGRHILFTDSAPGEQSDIYIIGIEGGAPKILLKHPAAEKYPRWSPDGKFAVFLSSRLGSFALWGVGVKNGEADGEPFLIQEGMNNSYLLNWTTGGLASWSVSMIYDIFLLDVDSATGEPTGELRQIEYSPTGVNISPVWSPDGKTLAFYKRNEEERGSIVLVSGPDTREYPMPAGQFSRWGVLRWTPDGRGIGLLSTDDQKNLADTDRKFLLHLDLESGIWKTNQIVPGQHVWRFEWSGDGRGVYLNNLGIEKEPAGIIKLDLKTGEKNLVYRSKPENEPAVYRWLKCSRDYKKLSFLVNGIDYMNVMVVDLETGESHPAAADFGGYSSWSPDGRMLVADNSWSQNKKMQSLFILKAGGGSPKEIDFGKTLPPKSEISFPDWSPSGDKIAVTVRQDQSGIFLYKNIIPPKK